MLSRTLQFAVAVIIIGASRVGAQSADVGPPPPVADAPGSESMVQAAPGGGDMVVLGPETRYVTRAWRDGTGRVQSGCTREHTDAPVQTNSQELR